jgi:serine protease AprX
MKTQKPDLYCMLSKNTTFLTVFFLVVLSYTQVFAQKIDPQLYVKLDEQAGAEALVLLKEQADLGFAHALHDKVQKGTYVFERLQATAAATQGSLLQILQRNGRSFTPYYLVNVIFVANLDRKTALELAAQPTVAGIWGNPHSQLDRPVIQGEPIANLRSAIEWGISRVGAPEVWGQGFRGQGVVIGGQDTGYDFRHPTLSKKYRGNAGNSTNHNYNWHDGVKAYSPLNKDTLNPCGLRSSIPCDDDAHGTHTMGTMIGDDGQGNQIGVAPAATWIGCRNMERGWGSPASYLDCFQWFLAPTDLKNEKPDPKMAPHVINNSWACVAEEGCNEGNFEIMERAVNNLKVAGVVVVVSAGNSGSNCRTVTEIPAFLPNSFSVGSVRQNDTISGFSSRGPATYKGQIIMKPNVTAPGSNVRSSVPNGGYANFSGTSMAGPHVAGAVALIISANPRLAGQVDKIEDLLEKSATPKTTSQTCGEVAGTTIPNPVYGFGRINVAAAVKAALSVTDTQDIAQKVQLRLFPNPIDSKGVLEIGPIAENGQLQVYDGMGRLLRQEKLLKQDFQRHELHFENFPAGLYFIRIQAGAQEGVLKVVHR